MHLLIFSGILPEALRTNCQRCTEKQRTVALRAIKRLKKEYPKVWAQLEEQWDPDSNYINKFESTFGAKPSQSVQIVNRFAPSENGNKSTENAITRIFTTPLPTSASTISSTSTTSATSTATTSRSTTPTKSTTTTTTTTTKATTVSTKTVPVTKPTTRRVSIINAITKQNVNTISASIKPTKRPRPIIGQGIEATVSLGTNIVGDFVRGLEIIGNRVVETGAEIAGVVLKSIARPL